MYILGQRKVVADKLLRPLHILILTLQRVPHYKLACAWIALAPLLHQMDMQHAACRCTGMQCLSFIALKPPLLPRVDPAHHYWAGEVLFQERSTLTTPYFLRSSERILDYPETTLRCLCGVNCVLGIRSLIEAMDIDSVVR
jgi:hypothetical protein